VVSPALTQRYGLSGLFYLTALLAVCGLFLLHSVIPTPAKEQFHGDTEANPSLFKSVITNQQLQRLNLGIFCQHFILTSTFFVLPLILLEQSRSGHLDQQWHFYLPLIVFSFICMIPFIILAEKKNQVKPVFLLAILFTALAQLALTVMHQQWIALCLLAFLYFVSFNLLEASLPSLISKLAPVNSKGTAMGVYSTSQFLGIFAGGSLAGVLFKFMGNQGIFVVNFLLAFIWFLSSLSMKITARQFHSNR
jgi:MFS family permease